MLVFFSLVIHIYGNTFRIRIHKDETISSNFVKTIGMAPIVCPNDQLFVRINKQVKNQVIIAATFSSVQRDLRSFNVVNDTQTTTKYEYVCHYIKIS